MSNPYNNKMVLSVSGSLLVASLAIIAWYQYRGLHNQNLTTLRQKDQQVTLGQQVSADAVSGQANEEVPQPLRASVDGQAVEVPAGTTKTVEHNGGETTISNGSDGATKVTQTNKNSNISNAQVNISSGTASNQSNTGTSSTYSNSFGQNYQSSNGFSYSVGAVSTTVSN